MSESQQLIDIIRQVIRQETSNNARILVRDGYISTVSEYQVSAYLDGDEENLVDGIEPLYGIQHAAGQYVTVATNESGTAWISRMRETGGAFLTIVHASGGDDLPALQAASVEGARIWLPDEAYNLSDEWWITANNVHVMGRGSGRRQSDGWPVDGTTTLHRTADTGATAVVRFAPLAAPVYSSGAIPPQMGGSLSDLNIRGNGYADYGLLIQGTQGVSTFDVNVCSSTVVEVWMDARGNGTPADDYAARGGAHHRMDIGATGSTKGLYLGKIYGMEFYGLLVAHGDGIGVHVANSDDVTMYSPYVTGGPGLDMDINPGYNFTTISGYPSYGQDGVHGGGITVRSAARAVQMIGRSTIDWAADVVPTVEAGGQFHQTNDRGEGTHSVAYTFGVPDLATSGALNAFRTQPIPGGTVSGVTMPRSGTLTAVSMNIQNARTGGVCVMYILKNGANMGLTCQIDSITTQHTYNTAQVGSTNNTFVAGDRISVLTYVTSATFNEFASDATLMFEVTYD